VSQSAPADGCARAAHGERRQRQCQHRGADVRARVRSDRVAA
jgi:hypothetical protein